MAINEKSSDPQVAAVQGENSADGDGVVGRGRRGVVGDSPTFQGVFGHSVENAGVVGESEKFHAVFAISHSPNNAGVLGANDGGGAGVIGTIHEGNTGIGIIGESPSGDGVVGRGRRGVVGDSPTFQGVFGHSVENAGVVGESDKFHAVFGISHSTNNAGIFGANDVGGFAGIFDGRVSVTGNLDVSGDVNCLGADVAEDSDLEGDEAIPAGSVVCVGEGGGLRMSRRPYDTSVVGILSGATGYRPAIRLDRSPSDRTRLPVALMGKVMCLVDASSSPVRAGDLLTSSATPGHAMRVADGRSGAGAIVGKALRSASGGRCLVPVLAILQ